MTLVLMNCLVLIQIAALEKLEESGSSIREQAIDIEKQTQIMTFSDNYGLAKIVTGVTRTLDLS